MTSVVGVEHLGSLHALSRRGCIHISGSGAASSVPKAIMMSHLGVAEMVVAYA